MDLSLENIKQKLTADGNTISTVQLPTGQAMVGYQSKFKWTWFGTKLHLFTIIVQVPQVDAALLEKIINDSANYAQSMKGKLRGLQVGLAIIPVIISSAVTDDARSAALARPDKKWAIFNLPVVIDTSKNQTYTYKGKIIWGALYAGWLRSRVKAIFPDA